MSSNNDAKKSLSETPGMINRFWNRHGLQPLLECACSLKPMMQQRALIVPKATGVTLELGIGSGLNLEFYEHEKVTRLYGLDPEPAPHKNATARINSLTFPFEHINLPAETIPLNDNSCDTVLSTFTLCTIPDVPQALSEVRRVLKPNGKLLFCEHGLAPTAGVQRWQKSLTPGWQKIAGGCQLDRDIPAMIAAAGFKITELEQRYVTWPKPWTYIYRGSAE